MRGKTGRRWSIPTKSHRRRPRSRTRVSPGVTRGTVVGYQYRSYGDLYDLGVQVRDKAIAVTMSQSDSYAQAQQYANNDATRYSTHQAPQVKNYQPPTSGAPDDDS